MNVHNSPPPSNDLKLPSWLFEGAPPLDIESDRWGSRPLLKLLVLSSWVAPRYPVSGSSRKDTARSTDSSWSTPKLMFLHSVSLSGRGCAHSAWPSWQVQLCCGSCKSNRTSADASLNKNTLAEPDSNSQRVSILFRTVRAVKASAFGPAIDRNEPNSSNPAISSVFPNRDADSAAPRPEGRTLRMRARSRAREQPGRRRMQCVNERSRWWLSHSEGHSTCGEVSFPGSARFILQNQDGLILYPERPSSRPKPGQCCRQAPSKVALPWLLVVELAWAREWRQCCPAWEPAYWSQAGKAVCPEMRLCKCLIEHTPVPVLSRKQEVLDQTAQEIQSLTGNKVRPSNVTLLRTVSNFCLNWRPKLIHLWNWSKAYADEVFVVPTYLHQNAYSQDFTDTLVIFSATKSFTAEADLQANICLKIGLAVKLLVSKSLKCLWNLVESSPIGSSTISLGGLLHCQNAYSEKKNTRISVLS